MTNTHIVKMDALALRCPEFQVQLRRLIGNQEPSTLIHVMTREPAAERDSRLFCAHMGHTLLASDLRHGIWHLMIKVGGCNV